MNILDSIMTAGNGAAVRQIGSQLGLDEAQTAAALSALLPALSAGLRQNAQTPDGLDGLLGALLSGRHQRYVENPGVLGEAETVADGNGILGHILGSKDVSREVARRASAQSGVSADVLKQMLPVVATLVMGALARRQAQAGPAAASGGGLLDMLSPMLDANRDGSMVDDVMGMIGRFMGGR